MLANIFIFLWIFRTIKFVLFWVYLWQLKEYHVGRLLAYFSTQKGKKVIFGPLSSLKLLIFILFFYFPVIAFNALLVIYFAENIKFIFDIRQKNFKKPVKTFKTVFLVLFSLVIVFFAGLSVWQIQQTSQVAIYLLGFDILLPLIISAIVLIFQPLFVWARSSILQKAKRKIKKLKKDNKNFTVIGITGSYGKTSTKEFLKTILSEKFEVLSTPKNNNSEIGISRTILNDLKPEHEVFIAEMGAYNKGGIRLLCDIAQPDIGLVTGVNEQHLATFGTMENLLSAEGGKELAENLSQNGLIIINGDNKHCLNLYKKIEELNPFISKKIYTTEKNTVESDLWTEDRIIKKDGLSFVVLNNKKEMANFSANVLGSHNIQNLLAAILTAKELGMSFEEISRAAEKINPWQGSITFKKGINGIYVIDGSYSANPSGVIADLNYLNVFDGKRAIIMPCLIELGEKSAEIHELIGRKIAEVCDKAIILNEDFFEDIKRGTILGGMVESNILNLERTDEILKTINTSFKEGDVILVEGRVPNEIIKFLK